MKAGQVPYQSEPVFSDVAAIIIADRKPLDEFPSFSDHDLGKLAAVIAQRLHRAAHEPDLADPERLRTVISWSVSIIAPELTR